MSYSSPASSRIQSLLRTTLAVAGAAVLSLSARADGDGGRCDDREHHTPRPITILFIVDTTGYTVTPQGMHIAGEFASDASTTITTQWNPADPGGDMRHDFGNIYSVAVSFPATSAGDSLQFEFVRNNIWWDGVTDFSEGNPGTDTLTTCGVPDGTGGYNRIITIPNHDGVFFAKFDECGELTAF